MNQETTQKPHTNVHVFEQKTNLEQNVGEAISVELESRAGKPLLFLIAGGSSLKTLEFISTEHIGPQTTLSVLDERFSTDPQINNFLQLTDTTFYRNASANGAHFLITSPLPGETQDQVGFRWERELKNWYSLNPDGVVIALMGIGEDGHICGIMPYPEDLHFFTITFDSESKWVAAYNAEGKNQYPLRITTTLSFVRQTVSSAFIYVSGDKKKDIMKKILAMGSLAEHPARVIHLMKKVSIFTDISLK